MNVIALQENFPPNASIVKVAEQKFPPPTKSVGLFEDADAALALVSEAGQAVRKLEHDTRNLITRATNAAMAVKEKLDQTVARAEKAEAALQSAEAEISERSSLVEQARDEIAKLRTQLAAVEQRLAETTERAETAERGVEHANQCIQRIVMAIRTELPIAPAAIGSA
jgi:chromosome segregation ATPase